MRISSIIESFGYAIVKFIIYTIIFSIVFVLFFGTDDLLNSVLRWCFPMSIGTFLGYLGGKSFTFLVKPTNVFFLGIGIITMNIAAHVFLGKMCFEDQTWLSNAIFTSIPLLWGFLKGVPDGFPSNKVEENDSADS